MKSCRNRSSSLRLVLGLCLLWPVGAGAAAAEDVPGRSVAEPVLPVGEDPQRNDPAPDGPAPEHIAPEYRVGVTPADHYWVPRAELAPAVRARTPEYCAGGYLAPAFPQPLGSVAESFPMHVEAAQGSYGRAGAIELSGGVRIEQGNRQLRTDHATLLQSTGDAALEGGVTVLQPGTALQAQRADINVNTRAALLEGVDFLFFDSLLRGTATSLAQDPAGNLDMRRGTFTRCEPGNDNWLVSAGSVRIDEGESYGIARNAVLRVKNVPVLYTPWLRFPVSDERQSGWLFPNLGYSDSDGLDISLPYYFNLAPNYDMTLMPRSVTERGVGLEGEFRHLARRQQTTLSGAYLRRDRLYNGRLERDDFDDLLAAGQISGEFDPADRWLYAIDHAGSFGRFRTYIDYTAVSDRDYFRGLGTDLGVSSQIALERRGEIRFREGNLQMRLWAQRFQRLDEGRVDPYQRLPQFDVRYRGDLPGPLEWSIAADVVSFQRDNDALTGLNRATGERLHLDPRIRLPLHAPWGFLTLTGGYRYTDYRLSDLASNFDSRPRRRIGMGSLHAGLFFERELELFGTALTQTLEPELFYLYQEFEDQSNLPRFDATLMTFSYSQLFRDNRFSGTDRIGDANQIAAGVTTRFVNSTDGREYLRASVGQIAYLKDRRVTLAGAPGPAEERSRSPVAGELSGQIGGPWRFTGTVIYDPETERVDEGALALRYRRDNRHIANIGYRNRSNRDLVRQPRINQTDLSFYWPVSTHFSVLGRWNHDLDSGRTVEGFGGIEYNDCCWQIRLLARRFLESPTGADPDTVAVDTLRADEGIFLQIIFKGLAGFGTSVESMLERGIRGYRTEAF